MVSSSPALVAMRIDEKPIRPGDVHTFKKNWLVLVLHGEK